MVCREAEQEQSANHAAGWAAAGPCVPGAAPAATPPLLSHRPSGSSAGTQCTGMTHTTSASCSAHLLKPSHPEQVFAAVSASGVDPSLHESYMRRLSLESQLASCTDGFVALSRTLQPSLRACFWQQPWVECSLHAPHLTVDSLCCTTWLAPLMPGRGVYPTPHGVCESLPKPAPPPSKQCLARVLQATTVAPAGAKCDHWRKMDSGVWHAGSCLVLP